MIIVTGAAGFIGSNIVKELNERGERNILAVDDLTDGKKFKNLVDCDIIDYLDQEDFLAKIISEYKFAQSIRAIIHQGACSDTTEWNGRFMLRNNYEYSKHLLHYCQRQKLPFIYASSGAVYGGGAVFKESFEYESPLNVYGYSKYLFDQYVRRILPSAKSQIVGLRYFNVYGPRENHKGAMASVAFHFNNQIQHSGTLKLFSGCDGYADGEQKRDFVYVGDAVDINLWFLENPDKSGIFNVGTGRSESFNAVAQAVIAFHNKGKIEYIPFPDNLKGRYQSFTQADISKLRNAGYESELKTVAQGVREYMAWLMQANVE